MGTAALYTTTSYVQASKHPLLARSSRICDVRPTPAHKNVLDTQQVSIQIIFITSATHTNNPTNPKVDHKPTPKHVIVNLTDRRHAEHAK